MLQPMSLEQIRSLHSSGGQPDTEQGNVPSENKSVPSLEEIRKMAPKPKAPINDLATEDKGVDESLPELLGRGLLFGVESAGAGIQELVRSGITDVTGIDVLSDFKKMRIERTEDFAAYTDRMNDLEHRVFWVGGYTGQAGSFMAAPTRTLGQVVGTSMFASASLPTEQGDPSLLSQERTMNALVGAGAGLFPQALINTGKAIVGKVLIDPIKAVTGFFSRSGGKKEATKGVTSIATKEATDAAERLGVKITPAEASANPIILSREARAVSDLRPEQALKAGEINASRTRELAETIDGFVTSILPEGKVAVRATLNKLYGAAFKVRMNPKLVEQMEDNTIYSAAKKSLLSDPAKKTQFEALEEGSLGQVEMVRRAISKEANAAAKSIDSLERSKAGALRSVNTLLKGALQKASPEYTKALPIAQRQIAQKRILDDLAKVKTKGSETGTSVYNATPDQFYDAILSTPQQRKELARQLKEVGGSSQAIDDLAVVLARIKNTPFKALSAAQNQLGAGMATGGFGAAGVVIHNTTSFLRGRHNLAMVELITNGKWQNSLTKIRKIKNPAKQLRALSTALAYVTTDNIDQLKREASEEVRDAARSITGGNQ